MATTRPSSLPSSTWRVFTPTTPGRSPIIPRRSCCSGSSPTRTPTSIPMTTIASPFVAKAFIALAEYVRGGLKDIGVAPNPRRATNYLHHAAIFFGDKEAQFELAKLYLSGEGGNDDVRRGLHYLSALSEQSYPAAQALLAELLWKGPLREVRRAPRPGAHHHGSRERTRTRSHLDRRDLSQHLSARRRRARARRPLASWRGGARCSHGRSPSPSIAWALAARDLQPERQCSNGEAVAIRGRTQRQRDPAPPAARKPEVMQGSTLPLRLPRRRRDQALDE